MATKTKPFSVKKRAGRNVTPQDHEVLRQVEDKLRVGGYTVLGSLFARVPGLLIFFATTYRYGALEAGDVPPFGVTRVSFLNNGDVTVKVMGCLPDEGEHPKLDIKWN